MKTLRDKPEFLLDLAKCQDLEDVRAWAVKYDIELRRHSRLAFAHLLDIDDNLEQLLGYLEDSALNNSANLNELLRRKAHYLVEHNAATIVEQWIRKTLVLGQRSEEQILLLLEYLSEINSATEDEEVKCRLLASLFEGLKSSAVLGINEVSTNVLDKLLRVTVRGRFSRMSYDLGLCIIRALEHTRSKNLVHSITSFVQTGIQAKLSSDQDPRQLENLLRQLFEMLQQLPTSVSSHVVLQSSEYLINQKRCLPELNAPLLKLLIQWWEHMRSSKIADQEANKRFLERLLAGKPLVIIGTYLQNLDDSATAHFLLRREFGRFINQGDRVPLVERFRNLLHRREDETPYVTAIRAASEFVDISDRCFQRVFRLLLMMQESGTIVKVIAGLEKYNIIVSEYVVHHTLKVGMHWQSHRAEAILGIYRRLPLKRCPELAERLISNIRRHPNEALRKYKIDCVRDQATDRSFSGSIQARIQLLQRMAIAYSLATHLTPRMAFGFVYKCYILQRRWRLGYPGIGMLQALVHAGIMWPLQLGKWVSTMRIKWLLGIIEQVEGAKVARGVDEAIYVWRGQNIRRFQSLQRRRTRGSCTPSDWSREKFLGNSRNRWSRVKKRVETVHLKCGRR